MGEKFSFDVSFRLSGRTTVDVPDSIETNEEAEKWVLANWSTVRFPNREDWKYVVGSDKPHFEAMSELWIPGEFDALDLHEPTFEQERLENACQPSPNAE